MPRFLLVFCVLVLACSCGSSGGGGSGGNGDLARTQLSSVQISPDVSVAVSPGSMTTGARVGDVAGLGPQDDPLRGVFRFSLDGKVPRGSTIASVTLIVPVVGGDGQPETIPPVFFDARPLATSALIHPTDVLTGDWSAYGPSTEVGLPLDDGPMVPRLWELHHEGGTGLTLAVEAVVGTQAGSQPLTEDLLIRVRGTPNNSGMTDEWGLGGLHVPSNAVHLVKLQVNFVEPIF